MAKSGIQSLSLCARLMLDMHSLNNEGAEGNQLQTRMVHIVHGGASGENGKAPAMAVVNAISGDMLKHIQAQHFHAIAQDRELPLCAGCQRFDANRINWDAEFFSTLKDVKDNEVIIDRVLNHCAMDDVEGILITAGNRSTPRKSTVEFGWLIGLPEVTRTESYFHVKYDPAGRGSGSGGEQGSNLGQNIFYRPASSGVYALVVHVELSRVGFNDVARRYAVVDEAERRRRQAALLQSVAHTLLKPSGAHRNTQLPHVVDCSGIVAVSRGTLPAPTISPLNDGYRAEVAGVAEQLNRLQPDGDGIETVPFESQSEFARVMADLIKEFE